MTGTEVDHGIRLLTGNAEQGDNGSNPRRLLKGLTQRRWPRHRVTGSVNGALTSRHLSTYPHFGLDIVEIVLVKSARGFLYHAVSLYITQAVNLLGVRTSVTPHRRDRLALKGSVFSSQGSFFFPYPRQAQPVLFNLQLAHAPFTSLSICHGSYRRCFSEVSAFRTPRSHPV